MKIKQFLELKFPGLSRLYWPIRSVLKVRRREDLYFLSFYLKHVRGSKSQAMQDVFFLWAHREDVRQPNSTYPPFLIEVGANHPIHGSNSYYLESLGWNGLLIEPNPLLAAELRASRQWSVSEFACSDSSGHVVTLSVPVNQSGRAFISSKELDTSASSELTAFKTETRRLSDLMDEYQLQHHDFCLSVDVEGHELEVLAGIDFERHHFYAITIEHNYDASRLAQIEEMLEQKGFKRVLSNVSWFDAWFIFVSA